MTTILHVEDDSNLAELVQFSFESLGFRGRNLIAGSVEAVEKILSNTGTSGIDLIIVDMSLPDGTGLDVVRIVRANPVYAQVPVLILSSDTDPDKVNRAYALGANCYLKKMPPGRSMIDVVKALYEHWLQDALLPRHPPNGRTRQMISRVVQFRTRLADIYMRIAQHQVPDSEFWMSIALREGNLANLFAFVGRQLRGELPGKTLDMIEVYQRDADRVFTTIERALDERPIRTPEDAYRIMLDYLFWFKVEPFAQMSSSLFPVAPAAMETMIDLGVSNLEAFGVWLETRVADSAVSDRIAAIRADVSRLRSISANSGPSGSQSPDDCPLESHRDPYSVS